MLKITNLCAGYGDLQVLYDVSLTVQDGQVVSLVGSNGAGKTTLLRILSGLNKTISGTVEFDGVDLLSVRPNKKIELGISHIPQGRGILGTLTVKENLIMGAYPKQYHHLVAEGIERAFSAFPILKERQNQMAGSLSGGEQQMLAIARALMINPKLLMLDEPSLGLAPIVVNEMFDIIRSVATTGVSILLVEQNLKQALGVASYGYVLETGRIVMEGEAQTLLNDPGIQAAYLGI